MYIIHLKGRANPIEVDRVEGEKIKALWAEDTKSETPIEVRDRMFRLSQINTIERQSDTHATAAPEQAMPLTPEEKQKRDEILARVRVELIGKGVIRGNT